MNEQEKQILEIEKRMGEISTELIDDAKKDIKERLSAVDMKTRNDEVDKLLESRDALIAAQELIERSNLQPYKSKVASNGSGGQLSVREEMMDKLGAAFKRMFAVSDDSDNSDFGAPSARQEVVNIKFRDMEKLAEGLELRALGLDTSGIVLTQMFDLNIGQEHQQYSNSADMVQVKNGGKNQIFTHPFIKTQTIAGMVKDSEEYTATDPVPGSVAIPAGKVVANITLEEGLVKLSNINYAGEVMRLIMISLKMKIAEQIVKGTGLAIDSDPVLKYFTGIYEATGDVAPVELEASAVTVDVLRDLMLAYGNDETTGGGAGMVLMLNKLDLGILTKLKDGNSRYFFRWEPSVNGNTGVITIGEVGKDVTSELKNNYVINSNCNDFASASADDLTMIYGNLNDYLMPIFGEGMEIRQDRPTNGNYTTLASLYAGGNIGGFKKFVVLKKVAP